MDPDPDEVIGPGAEFINWDNKEAIQGNIPYPQHNILTEQARTLISLDKQCALFCGGRRCKYERSDCWPNQMAINGLYSHWITENILAMSRPTTPAMKEFNIVGQFSQCSIKTVINLQQAGEHASCGPGLERSGFSYCPQDFMDENIFFYNFGWPDYGATTHGRILDMVRVMQFAVSLGKVAIHCHAGLGRTGLLICCYLVFTNRMSANDAINYIREKRARSIQTRKQMQCLKEFADFLKQLWIVFPTSPDIACEFTFQQYLNRQRKLLHGYELRKLKHIPKIIYYVCERLLELASRGNASSLRKGIEKMTIPPTSLFKEGGIQDEPEQIHYTGLTSSVDRRVGDSEDKPLYDGKSDGLSSFNHSSDIILDSPTSGTVCGVDALEYHALNQTNRETRSDTVCGDKVSKNEINSGASAAAVAFPASIPSTVPEVVGEFASDMESTLFEMSGLHLWWEQIMTAAPGSSEKAEAVAKALCDITWGEATILRRDFIMQELNSCDSGWKSVASEADPTVLVALLWEWLNRLKEPILRYQDLKNLLPLSENPFLGLSTLEKSPHATIDYLNKVIVRLLPLPEKLLNHVLEVLLSYLTHHYIIVEPCDQHWRCGHWLDLPHPMPLALMHFFRCLLQMNQKNMTDKMKCRETPPAPS